MGAPYYNDDTGYIKVYRADDDGGNRVQLGPTIYGDATYDWFGQSVDITANGTTIICSSPVGDGPGYVRVFSLVGGNDDLDTATWDQIRQDIIGKANDDWFELSVSISEDGKTIAVGAIFNDGDNGVDLGHVRIYHLEEDGGRRWEQIGQDIDGEAANDWSGWSVSVSAYGMTVAIGYPDNYDNGDAWNVSGQMRVYQIDSQGSSWERLGQVIYGNTRMIISGGL
jgi:hypothetical protein